MSRKKAIDDNKVKTLPIALNLEGKCVLFVGGGHVTFRKIGAWMGRGAKLIVVSPQICDKLKVLLMTTEEIIWYERPFVFNDLDAVDLAIIATNDVALNQWIAEYCQKHRIWYSRVDGGPADFNAMAMIESGHLQVGIGTNGLAPVVLKAIKAHLETAISEGNFEHRIELLGELKRRLKREVETQSEREAFLREASEYSIEELERLLADEGVYRWNKG